jgi:hypothetical protein
MCAAKCAAGPLLRRSRMTQEERSKKRRRPPSPAQPDDPGGAQQKAPQAPFSGIAGVSVAGLRESATALRFSTRELLVGHRAYACRLFQLPTYTSKTLHRVGLAVIIPATAKLALITSVAAVVEVGDASWCRPRWRLRGLGYWREGPGRGYRPHLRGFG